MSLIDPRTVIWLTSIMCGLMALVLYALKRHYPTPIKGLGEWSAGLMVCFGAGLLVAARGYLPDFVSVNVGCALIWWGLCLTYFGTQRFFGIRPRPAPWATLVAATFLAQTWFTLVEPRYHLRLLLATLLQCYLFGMHAHLIFKWRSARFARTLAAGVLTACAAVQLVRLATSFLAPIGPDLLDASPAQLIYLTGFAVFVFLFSICLVLMAFDRLVLELEHLATHDSLTNALTRRYMNEACQKELERCRRHGRSMALLMIDLDHFKEVNDHYGHQAGDRVLVNFVLKVNGLLRRPDLLGRFGGEEFMALLPETSLEEALSVAERIRAACALASQEPSCSVSIGVTTNQKDTDTVDTLLARADAAMYLAKASGRNRVEAS